MAELPKQMVRLFERRDFWAGALITRHALAATAEGSDHRVQAEGAARIMDVLGGLDKGTPIKDIPAFQRWLGDPTRFTRSS